MGRADDKEGEALLSEADGEKDSCNDTSEADEEKDREKDNSDIEDSNIDSRKKYKCKQPGCSARFLRPSRLTWHLRKHNDERPYKCDQEGCDRAYTNSSHLKRHLNTTHKPVTKTYECQECGTAVGSLFSLKRHHKKIHNPQRLTCAECGAKFRKKHCYNEHLSMHAGIAMYKCDICNQNFSQLRLFKKHQRVHEPQKTYPCTSTGCTEIFDKWTKLNKHLETEHEFGHSCDKCDKRFKHKKLLATHKAAHDKAGFVKPCPYENCPRFYYYAKNLDEHVLTAHLGRRFYCDNCDKSFRFKSTIARHMQIVHGGKKMPMSKRKTPRRRKDAGVHRKSMAAKLAGIELPVNLEMRVLRRQPRICLERYVKKSTDRSDRRSDGISPSLPNTVDSVTLDTLEKLIEDSSDRCEREEKEISPFLSNELESETPAIAEGHTARALDTSYCDNERTSSGSINEAENEKSLAGEVWVEEILESSGLKNEEASLLPNGTLMIVEEAFKTSEQQKEEVLVSSLLNDLENEESMKVVERYLETSEKEGETALTNDTPLTNTLQTEKPIVLAECGEELLVTSEQNYEEISRWLNTDSVEETVPLIFKDILNEWP